MVTKLTVIPTGAGAAVLLILLAYKVDVEWWAWLILLSLYLSLAPIGGYLDVRRQRDDAEADRDAAHGATAAAVAALDKATIERDRLREANHALDVELARLKGATEATKTVNMAFYVRGDLVLGGEGGPGARSDSGD